MILSNKDILHKVYTQEIVIKPFYSEKTKVFGLSFGLTYAGYDVRNANHVIIRPKGFVISSIEEFLSVPNDVVAKVYDKSTNARRGISLFNTVIEPGWRGYLTIEIYNASDEIIEIPVGYPIAQIQFEQLSSPVEKGYDGKYQDQPDHPVYARYEK